MDVDFQMFHEAKGLRDKVPAPLDHQKAEDSEKPSASALLTCQAADYGSQQIHEMGI